MSPYDPGLRCDDRFGAAAEFIEQCRYLIARERDKPSIGTALHAREPFAADRVGDDDRRLTALDRQPREGLLHVVEIVAVDTRRGPAERGKLRFDRLEGHQILGAHVG